MMRLIGHTNIDFMSWFPYCLTASVLITVMAIVRVVRSRQGPVRHRLHRRRFGAGGVRQAAEDRRRSRAAERSGPSGDVCPTWPSPTCGWKAKSRGLQFLINTSEPDPKKVQDKLTRGFRRQAGAQLGRLHRAGDDFAPSPAKETRRAGERAAGRRAPAKKPAEPAKKGQSRSDLPSRSMLAFAGDDFVGACLGR